MTFSEIAGQVLGRMFPSLGVRGVPSQLELCDFGRGCVSLAVRFQVMHCKSRLPPPLMMFSLNLFWPGHESVPFTMIKMFREIRFEINRSVLFKTFKCIRLPIRISMDARCPVLFRG